LGIKGDYEQSEKYLRQALEAFQQKYNRPHLNTLAVKNEIGNLYLNIGEHQKAKELFSNTLSETIRLLGKNNYRVAIIYDHIAVNYISLADYDSAAIYSQWALDIYNQIYDGN